MVRNCDICKKDAITHPNISFHRLPKDIEKKNIWISLLGCENVSFKKRFVFVCSDHFDPNDIGNRPNGHKMLKYDAYPLPYHSAFETTIESSSDEQEEADFDADAVTTMHGKKCQYFNCKMSNQKDRNLRLYQFPVDDPIRCELWVIHSGNSDLATMSPNVLARKFLCSKHFSDEQIKPRRLPLNAVPARCIPDPRTVAEVKKSPELRVRHVSRTYEKTKLTSLLANQSEEKEESKEKIDVDANVVNQGNSTNEGNFEHVYIKKEVDQQCEIDQKETFVEELDNGSFETVNTKEEIIHIKIETDDNKEQFENYIPNKMEKYSKPEINDLYVDTTGTEEEIIDVKIEPEESKEQFENLIHDIPTFSEVTKNEPMKYIGTVNTDEEINKMNLQPESTEQKSEKTTHQKRKFADNIEINISSKKEKKSQQGINCLNIYNLSQDSNIPEVKSEPVDITEQFDKNEY